MGLPPDNLHSRRFLKLKDQSVQPVDGPDAVMDARKSKCGEDNARLICCRPLFKLKLDWCAVL